MHGTPGNAAADSAACRTDGYGKDSAMPATTQPQLSEPPLSEERQVKALLHLIEDLGYQVNVSQDGDWTVSILGSPGEQTTIAYATAREVVAAAKCLAESVQFDLDSDPLRATS